MSKNFLCCQPAIAGADQHVYQIVAGLLQGHFTPQNGRERLTAMLGLNLLNTTKINKYFSRILSKMNSVKY